MKDTSLYFNPDMADNQREIMFRQVGLLWEQLEEKWVQLKPSHALPDLECQDRLALLFTQGLITKHQYDCAVMICRIKASIQSSSENDLSIIVKATECLLMSHELSDTQEEVGLSEYVINLEKLAAYYNLSNEEHEVSRQKLIELKSSRVLIWQWDPTRGEASVVIDHLTVDQEKINFTTLAKEDFKMLNLAIERCGLPMYVFAHGLKKQDECWTCSHIIIQPDFLVDVTSITSCVSTGKTFALQHIPKLFLYNPSGLAILVGTTVNDFLDELIIKPEANYEDLSKNLFQKNGLAFCLLNDADVADFNQMVNIQFNTLKKVVNGHFDGRVKALEDCLLEPSFYSVAYGIQGRLDVYYAPQHTSDLPIEERSKDLVIELKSGKPFRSNPYGINLDHQVQTMLYELMIDSVFEGRRYHEAMILYSADNVKPLRLSPSTAELYEEIIRARNAIVLIQILLAFPETEGIYLLDRINLEYFKNAGSFAYRDAKLWLEIYGSLSEIEKEYIREFSQFIAMEQWISRLGKNSGQASTGLASMWLTDRFEKEINYGIIADLHIESLDTLNDDYPIIHLRSNTALHNFRIGDTMVLYQSLHNTSDVLHQQIFKCTMIEMNQNMLVVRLRTKQFPVYLRNTQHTWNLEHDILDRSFIHQYENLFLFAQADPSLRSSYLGLTATQDNDQLTKNNTEFEEDEWLPRVIDRAMNAAPFHLIWGPPGSGKTSMVIKKLVEKLMNKTEQNILLLAYTNRAVDEICDAIASLGEEWKSAIVRIGSRYSIDAKYKENLLDEYIKEHNSRRKLSYFLQKSRIICGTIASLQGKKEIFRLKKFDTIIVDEASQILEPNLIGLLVQARQSILIGDHMQLPAVCAQTEEEAAIKSEGLRKVGFHQKNQSLFERLLHQCVSYKQDHLYTMLEFQGRMHEDLMKFPAQYFYKGRLKIFPQASSRQTKAYAESFTGDFASSHYLLKSRTIYIDIQAEQSVNEKVNLAEAKEVASLIQNYITLYKASAKPWTEETLGVICPFRAQIACIKQQIAEIGLDKWPVTVDTAERYQGGARDIIIISMVIKQPEQIIQISSLNEDGLDRKLNVALTRAREQVILIGNKSILCRTNELYQKLFESYDSIHDLKEVIN